MELELSQDQIDALVEVCNHVIQAVIEVWKKIKDAVIRAAIELYEKFFKPIIRHCFLLQLLEWKVPYWLARILQKITPWVWVMKYGALWWRNKMSVGVV